MAGVMGTPSPQQHQPLPAWISPWIAVTTQVGVPTVFAGILLWFVLFRLDGMLQAIESGEEKRTGIILEMHKDLVNALGAQADRFEKAIQENIAANERLQEDATSERRVIIEKLSRDNGNSR
jgi:hypothetical protein